MGSVRPVEVRARDWLDSQILSHEACADRLAGIKNDAVNIEAQAEQVGRMRGEIEVWRYLRSLLPHDAEVHRG